VEEHDPEAEEDEEEDGEEEEEDVMEEEEEEEEEDDEEEKENHEEENEMEEEVEDLVAKSKGNVLAEMDNMHDFVAAMEQFKTEKSGLPPMPIKMEAGIELLSMIRQSNASMKLKIVKWIEQYYIKSRKVLKPPPCDKVTKYLCSHYKLDCLKPCQSVCRLPSSNLSFNVVRHRFFACFFIANG